MIDHDRALQLAASALDFGLSDTDRTALQEHLDGCPACRATVERLRADARRIADLPLVAAPEGLRARVLDSAGAPADAARAPAPPVVQDAPIPLANGRRRTTPILAPRDRRPFAVLFAAAAVVVLVGGVLFWRSEPDQGAGVAAASPGAAGPAASGPASPGGGPAASGPSASGPASPGGGPGGPVAEDGWTPTADLTADDAKGGLVALGSGFRLASLDGTPAATLAAHLTADPPITFAVAADADGRSARITPDEPLTPGAVYRFTLTADDGRTRDSWAFQARQPVTVVETVPADSESGVPTDTGIEVTFDQEGVVGAADHVTIEPKVSGRFEQHGRTLAFVPARRLAAGTIYTVTVGRGVAIEGTDEILESAFRFKFETAAASVKGKVRTTFQFTDEVIESATGERATIALWAFQESVGDAEAPRPKTARIEVDRLADVDAAVAAYRQVRASPSWSRASAAGLLPTADLQTTLSIDAQLHEQDDGLWFQLPEVLPAGWYVVTVRSGTRPVQAILQVTDIAGYLVVTETRTLVWANDLASGAPVVGATVATDGIDLGRTGDDGTRIADTPAGLKGSDEPCTDDCWPVVTVRSGDRATFLPANGGRQAAGFGYEGESGYGVNPGPAHAARYWTAFGTDRTLYRQTDTVNVWGVVRDRDTGAVPASVTVRLFASAEDEANGVGAPLSTVEVHPNAIGAYSASVALNDVPERRYVVDASVAGDPIGSRSFQVDRVQKPAYLLEVVTGRRVYFEGDQIRVTATARFYEGSPVPGVRLNTESYDTKTMTTDATGTASVRTTVRFDQSATSSEPDIRTVTVSPARAEEGEISGASRDIIAFPSTWTTGAAAVIGDGRVTVTGSVHAVDRERLEREIASGISLPDLQPAGDPIAGKSATVTFIELTEHRVQTGTRYDFVEKKAEPQYEYQTTERVAGTVRVTTGQDGTFNASINSNSGHSYLVRVSATDPDKHASSWIGYASEPGTRNDLSGSSLGLTADPSKESGEFGVGEPIDVTMDDGHEAPPGADRYLFYTTQRGLRDVDVQSSARYRGTFADWAPPGMSITGVRFIGSGYVEGSTFQALFRASDRRLSVELAANADRYGPGAEVTVTVTTRDPTGQPVPSTVVLRGVDEKLFTIGGAEAADPLGELYQGVESGIVATYRSHHEPTHFPEGGDTTGGGSDGAGGRRDFRDWVLFKSVDTGPDGRAVVTFRVSDDLTSWRVSASAFADGVKAGEGTIGIPVGLPFFVDATIAPEYLVSDRPSIGLRSYGTALESSATVTYAVDSDSLGLHVAGLRAEAFQTTTVPLPRLTVGRHVVTITATTGSGAAARRDVLTRTFTVVASRLARTRAQYIEPTADTRFEGGDGWVDVVVSDAGAGRYVPLLLGLTGTDSARLERTLAAALAATLLTERLGVSGVVATTDFDPRTYRASDDGLSILPYSSASLDASAMAALVAPERLESDRLRTYLSAIVSDDKQTRERRMYALAGLAGLHVGVLPQIQAAAADPDLTIRERLMLGLGAAALGDAATARRIGADLEAGHAEVTSDDARLRVGDTAADITAGTALMAMLAAANGDSLAARFWSYVEENADDDAVYGLHAVGFVSRLLERRADRPASFAYTIAGKRQVVELDPGETVQLSLTHEQLGSLAIEEVNGQVGVTTTWREPVTASAVGKDPDLKISRRVTPSGTIATSALVTVDLTVTLGPKAPNGCHLVTDFVPSGLVPVGNLQRVADPDEESPPPRGVEYPYSQIGQRVLFCADKTTNKGVAHLRYFARVVTAGTYTWEPAVVESRTQANRAALTEQTTVTIR